MGNTRQGRAAAARPAGHNRAVALPTTTSQSSTRFLARCAALFALAVGLAASLASIEPSPSSEVDRVATELAPAVAEHCARCHGLEKTNGGVTLAGVRDAADVARDRATWSRALAQLRAEKMPPKRAPQPSAAQRAMMIAALEGELLRGGIGGDSAKVTVRRLNRTEFKNTIRDLFGVVYDAEARLPADPPTYGFDSLGDGLTASPLLLEKYWDAAGEIADRLFGDATLRRRLLDAAGSPTEPVDAERVLRYLLERAFRRPLEEGELESRLQIVNAEMERGRSKDEALHAALRSVLLSPHFLFRWEHDRPGPRRSGERPLGDFELASRLSYFLWSTTPDEELWHSARTGALSGEAELRAQVRRMLASPRSLALSTEFAGQWLRFREILSVAVDFRRFPSFDWRLRHAMNDEARCFFEGLIREDRSILELLDSKYTYLNETLAAHYGIAGVKGAEMRKVDLPDRRRGGVLGMGAVLTVTSYPLRTSPVLRGRYVLDQILGEPPGPPPPGVPALPKDDHQPDKLTPRERLEEHRKNPACASCHARLDPPGFALEPYDGIGAWRDQFLGKPIDARATLADGVVVDGPVELKDALLARKEVFVRSMAERMFTYAVGRPVDAADAPVLDGIVREVAASGYRMSALVLGVVLCDPFRRRGST